MIGSRSVTIEKTWTPSEPFRRGYEVETSKEVFCLNENLSISGYGRDIELVRLPVDSYDPTKVHEVELTEDEINALLVWMHGLVGTVHISDEMYQQASDNKGMKNNFNAGQRVVTELAKTEQRTIVGKLPRTG